MKPKNMPMGKLTPKMASTIRMKADKMMKSGALPKGDKDSAAGAAT